MRIERIKPKIAQEVAIGEKLEGFFQEVNDLIKQIADKRDNDHSSRTGSHAGELGFYLWLSSAPPLRPTGSGDG